MSILSLLLATACGIGFISVILFLLFGQITVRKLRKNPATKHELGTELVSGWDIVNAAQALAVPESIIRKFKNSGQAVGFFVLLADDVIGFVSGVIGVIRCVGCFWLKFDMR